MAKATKTKAKKTEKLIVSLVGALIDESGSMMAVRDDTIGGYNSFISTIQKEQTGKKAFVSTFLFDAVPNVSIIRTIQDANDLQKAIPLSAANYSPRGGTPLYDAIGLAIQAIDKAVTTHGVDKITFLIQTDGQENQSREFSHASVKALIEARTKDGWQIVFLGADLSNAHAVGTGLGVMAQNSMMYAKGKTNQTFAAMASSTASYRGMASAGSAVTLSAAEKRNLQE